MIGSFWYFNQAVGYHSIDVNPSIELSYNRMNKIVEIKALNPDAIAGSAVVSAGGGCVTVGAGASAQAVSTKAVIISTAST